VSHPHPSYTLIPLSTHIPRSSSILRLTVTSWFTLTRTQRSPKTTELYVNIEPEESLPNESHWDPRNIPQHKFLLDFWILNFFLRGWGSHTPRAGGRLPPHSFDYTLARTGRTLILVTERTGENHVAHVTADNLTSHLIRPLFRSVRLTRTVTDDGFSPMPWTRSCERYSSDGMIWEYLGPMQDKSKVRDSCRE